jgi:hypothetical protein
MEGIKREGRERKVRMGMRKRSGISFQVTALTEGKSFEKIPKL